MTKLYQKSEIIFTIIWIILYILGTTITDDISLRLGAAKSVTAIFYLLLSILLFAWIFSNKLNVKYGLCKVKYSIKSYLYFTPLLILITTNFWLGVELKLNLLESITYIITMLCVGFIEEIIFRGFLFKAMEKDNLKSACIVSSITFGIGHIINFIMGNGSILSNICQICYATAIGFLFVILFYKSKSLLPCIITHSLVNTFSLFLNQSALTPFWEIFISIVIISVSVTYSIYLIKKLPKENNKETQNQVNATNEKD